MCQHKRQNYRMTTKDKCTHVIQYIRSTECLGKILCSRLACMFTVPFHYFWSLECTYSSSYHYHEPPSNVLTLELEAGYMFILIMPVLCPCIRLQLLKGNVSFWTTFCAKYGSMGRRFTEPVHLSNDMHVNTDSALVNISLEWDTWFPC